MMKEDVDFKDGRHPVVEKVMTARSMFQMIVTWTRTGNLLITGPNMSGKSTYMRQIALTAILAQIGCFVPEQKQFCRFLIKFLRELERQMILISGQSTFMVEMLEAKNAITNATENSLILFDEIGRGTSTYDGMALAQAIIEYIHDRMVQKRCFPLITMN